MNSRGVPLAVLATALAALAAPRATAQSARERLLVSVDWLAQHLHDPDLVVLHVGPREDYDKEHIPGARFLDYQSIQRERSNAPDALRLELPEPRALQTALEEVGVTDRSRIVLAWGSEWVTPTARVMFTLTWAGLGERTAMLDGGLEAWKAAGNAVSHASPSAPEGHVTLHLDAALVVNAPWVQAHAADRGVRVVDARAPMYYDGVKDDRGHKGHIPGAASVPWTELIDETLHLKPAAQLEAVFRSAGVTRGDTVVTYCHIGQYATYTLFAARTLGHPVKLYDGAFQDWAQRGLPVEAKKRP